MTVYASKFIRALGVEGDIEVKELITSGAVNDIIVLSQNDEARVLRVRAREHLSLYERGFFKELLAAHFLAAAKPGAEHAAHNQAVLEYALQKTQDQEIPAPTHGLPQIFATGRTKINGNEIPWMLQDYIPGELIAQNPDKERWKALGRWLRTLHSYKLERAGRFDAPHRDIAPEQHIQTVIAEIQTRTPTTLHREFNINADGLCFSLCHNDFHCLNIKGEERILDWDNAGIAFPMQDLAKLSRWTALDENGYLAPNPEYFGAFMLGYMEAGGEGPDQKMLDMYELLFLCRAYRFERGREAEGRVPAPPIPGSDAYIGRIEQLCAATPSSA